MPKAFILFVFMTTSLTASMVHADWLRFRGPNGSGISTEDAATPTEWTTDSLKWKAELPGPGSSCPIVVGDKLLVTCWSGYGMDRNGDPGEQSKLRRHLICFNKKTGDKIWSKAIEPVLPEDRYGGMFAEHGYATHTPVSDGKHIYAFFGKTGVVAFDLEGNQIWKQGVGTESGARNWGTSSSPVLYKNLVIVPATAESESLVGLDKMTGKEVWRAEAAGFNSTWGSPILVKIDEERTDLVIAVPYEVWAFNPDTGKLRWFCEGPATSSFCSSVVADGDIVYAMETGRGGGGSIAVRAGGKGDVTETHVLWTGRHSSRIATPLLIDGRLYNVSNKTITCINTEDGEQVYRKRLSSARGGGAPQQEQGGRGFGRGGGGRGGQDYSSAVAADGKIYFVSRNGETFVIKAGDEFEQISANRLTNDSEDFSSTPAISDGMLFIRSDKNLYCVAKK